MIAFSSLGVATCAEARAAAAHAQAMPMGELKVGTVTAAETAAVAYPAVGESWASVSGF